MKYVPTKEDIAMIKAAAAREALISVGAVLLEPGYRYCTDEGWEGEGQMNIALVSDDPHFNNTDLADYGTWAEFRKGIDLTADGRGIVDFYIRKRGDQYSELLGNVTIHIRDGKLVRIHGYGPNTDYFNALP
jgi:hypothetical protein